jgi:hypothetical protein
MVLPTKVDLPRPQKERVNLHAYIVLTQGP